MILILAQAREWVGKLTIYPILRKLSALPGTNLFDVLGALDYTVGH